MREKLSFHLEKVLSLLVEGYTHEGIAERLVLSKSSVDTYVKRLKEYFADEPEMKDSHFSSASAVILIGQRYFKQGARVRKAMMTPEAQALLSADRVGWEGLLESRGMAIAGVNYQQAVQQLRKRVRELEREGAKQVDPRLLGYHFEELANYEAMVGDIPSARTNADRALQIFATLFKEQSSKDVRQGLVRAYNTGLQISNLRQLLDASLSYYRTLTPLAEEICDTYALAKARFGVAQAYFARGQLREAREYAIGAYAALPTILSSDLSWWAFRDHYFGTAWWMVMTPVLLGDIHMRLREPEIAKHFYKIGDENRLAAPHLADWKCPPFTGLYEWELLCQQNKVDAAEMHFAEIEPQLAKLGFPLRQCWVAMCYGDFLRRYKKDVEGARLSYERGRHLAIKHDAHELRKQLENRLAVLGR